MISEWANDGIERDAAQWFRRYNGKAPGSIAAPSPTCSDDALEHRQAVAQPLRPSVCCRRELVIAYSGHVERIRPIDPPALKTVAGVGVGQAALRHRSHHEASLGSASRAATSWFT